MNILFPLMILVFGGLAFWLLSASHVKKIYKVLIISAFCFFTSVVYLVSTSFLGWGADPKDLPSDVVTICHVGIEEPSKKAKREGGIWVTVLQPTIEYHDPLLKIFGHNVKHSERRMFIFPYSRELHKQMTQGGKGSVQARTQRGQLVRGKFSQMGKGEKGNGKDQGQGKGKGSDGKGKMAKGGGSHSQEQEWRFYNLKPSFFLSKD